MTEFIAPAVLVTVLLVLAETSYLTYRATRTNKIKHDSILLDTSVLIDGRIVAIARSGLLTAPLIVPKSVMHELQFMADKADHNKRERARFGLEVIEKLQEIEQTDLTIIDDGVTDVHGVDEQLIVLAKRYSARLCTIDYNLNKVARVQGVIIVNINELAHALRIVHLPGETVAVKLVQAGQEKKQAVGYLDDGTMTVVDDARDLIGETVEVAITRALQTAAGSMMFARLVSKRPKQNSGSAKRSENVSSQTTTAGSMVARNQRPSKARSASVRTTTEGNMLARDERSENAPSRTTTEATTIVAENDTTSQPVTDKTTSPVISKGQTTMTTSPKPKSTNNEQEPKAQQQPRQRNPRQPRSSQSRQQSLTPAQQKVAPRRRQDIEDSLIELANQ